MIKICLKQSDTACCDFRSYSISFTKLQICYKERERAYKGPSSKYTNHNFL